MSRLDTRLRITHGQQEREYRESPTRQILILILMFVFAGLCFAWCQTYSQRVHRNVAEREAKAQHEIKQLERDQQIVRRK